MRKLRLYLDTSVIGGYFDPEFEEATQKLFRYISIGVYDVLISDLTLKEIDNIPIQYRGKFNDFLDEYPFTIISLNQETELLAHEYIRSGIVTLKHINDARHVAIASLNQVDYIVSWNFKHLVNVRRIRAFNGVNLLKGYNTIDIRTSLEVIGHDSGAV